MFEFALVATFIFFPLVFGFVELGRRVFAKTTITAAAREGVRYAVVRGGESGITIDSATVADYVIGRTPLTGIIVRPRWQNAAKAYPTYAEVQVDYNYVPIVPLFPSTTMISKSRQIINY